MPSPAERQLADLAGLAVIGALLAPARLVHDGPNVCPFRLLTGRPCPACGLTRSWHAAARLELGTSFGFHPLGPVTLAAAVVAVGTNGGHDAPAWMRSRPLLAGLTAGWLAVWLVRLRRA